MLRLALGIEIEGFLNEEIMKNYNIKIGNYHNGKLLNAYWEAQSDSSLNNNDSNYMGVEFISIPILSIKQLDYAIDLLFSSLGVIEPNDDLNITNIINFNKTSGCHLHISIMNDKFVSNTVRNVRTSSAVLSFVKHKQAKIDVNEYKLYSDKLYNIINTTEEDDDNDNSVKWKPNYNPLLLLRFTSSNSIKELLKKEIKKTSNIYTYIAPATNDKIREEERRNFRIDHSSHSRCFNFLLDTPKINKDLLMKIEDEYYNRLYKHDGMQAYLWKSNYERDYYSDSKKINEAKDSGELQMAISFDRHGTWHTNIESIQERFIRDINDLKDACNYDDTIFIGERGLEWRGFNLIGCKTIGDIRTRLRIAYEVLSEILINKNNDGELNKIELDLDFNELLYSDHLRNNIFIIETKVKRKLRTKKFVLPNLSGIPIYNEENVLISDL